ncbi:MAG TPA: molecular chaperone [Sphingomicrobium sp.]|nr:molecular chaperone [Sphingomicrobium sp.]
MSVISKSLTGALLIAITTLPVAARAGVGDLLVAPTRIVLDGRRGTEVILNNIGDATATYRVSVEFRRMTAEGRLEDVAEPSAAEKLAEEMIVYAPRRVTLAPRQPQSIRISARPPQGIPDGEYRVHLLFRAIPPTRPVAAKPAEAPRGLSFALTPVYGVTIPVIVRLGQLQATAGIANVHLDSQDGKPVVAMDLSRKGSRSTFGEVRVFKAGIKDPIAQARSVAVYTEVGGRSVAVPVSDTFKGDIRGPVTVQYVETYDDGARTIAETQAVLR